jgi:Protein of unknown function with PCYCGC motif
MPRARRLAGGCVVVAALALVSGCSSSDSPQAPRPDRATSPASGASMVQTSEIAPGLPPLQGNLNVAPRPAEVVRAAYEFAARHPEVLKYIPCFCGCDAMGHKGNEDCFVSARDASGRVTAWEPHGMICEVCIDIATTARQMHNAGASIADIRQAIERQYAAPGRPRTPTPMPPGGGTR